MFNKRVKDSITVAKHMKIAEERTLKIYRKRALYVLLVQSLFLIGLIVAQVLSFSFYEDISVFLAIASVNINEFLNKWKDSFDITLINIWFQHHFLCRSNSPRILSNNVNVSQINNNFFQKLSLSFGTRNCCDLTAVNFQEWRSYKRRSRPIFKIFDSNHCFNSDNCDFGF